MAILSTQRPFHIRPSGGAALRDNIFIKASKALVKALDAMPEQEGDTVRDGEREILILVDRQYWIFNTTEKLLVSVF
ncbi:unnamed protein product, partial [Nesidiocoris tenuis]